MDYKYSTQQAANLLGISARAVRKHIERNNIKAQLLGRGYAVSSRSLKTFAVKRNFATKDQVAKW